MIVEKRSDRFLIVTGLVLSTLMGSAGCETGSPINETLSVTTGASEMAFPLTRANGTFSKAVMVRNAGSLAATLTGATVTSAATGSLLNSFTVTSSFPVTLQPNETTNLNVQFKSPGRGVFVANLDLSISVPDAGGNYRGPTVTAIGLGQSSTAAATGDFAVDRTVAVFRCDSTGANRSKMWFSNLGTESMLVDRIELSGSNAAEFRLETAVGNVDGGVSTFLGPGDRGSFEVVYSPRSGGTHFASLKTVTRSLFQVQDASVTLVGDTDPSNCVLSP